MVGFFFALIAVAATQGWTIYKQEWRPKELDEDWKLYEQAAFMIGWLLTIGVYWRAVGSVRRAIRNFPGDCRRMTMANGFGIPLPTGEGV